jgi:3-methylfumaryl-CoA hydratase
MPDSPAPEIDIEPIRAQLGRKVEDHDLAAAAPLRGMVVTFDRNETAPVEGEPVPPGWHLAYFPDASRLSGLGADGLPLERGVLPKMPLPRRMYAGASLTFHAPILVGDTLRRETEFSDVQLRKGSTGTLIVATQTRRIYTPRGLALTEDAISVFREAVPPGAQSGIPQTEPPPAGQTWFRTITPDPVSLFRYSALTFNPHRIHYDRPYAMNVEGYPGLVVHGPFSQQCLLDLLRDKTDRPLLKFVMRARAPIFDVAPFTLAGRMVNDNEADLFAMGPSGGISMQARATLG